MNRKKNKQQAMNLQVTNDLTVAVIPNLDHEFTMPTKEVAKGYGATEYSLRMAKKRHPLELIEGKHFISNVTLCHGASPGASKATMWTKRGIVRLGFFIRSERAKLFRDWAEDLVLNAIDPEVQELQTLVARAANVAGGQNRLGTRIGITKSILAHVQNRPQLVSAAMRARIKDACNHVLAHGMAPDVETVDYLMRIDDPVIRQGLWNKLKDGGAGIMKTITLTKEFADYIDVKELYDILDEIEYNYSLTAINDAPGMSQEAAPISKQMECLQQLKRLIRHCK